MKKHQARCPVYGISFLFIVYGSSESRKAEEALQSLFGTDSPLIQERPSLCLSSAGPSMIAIAIERGSKRQTIELMSHECLHAAQDIFLWRDIKWDLSNQEPQCYLHQWIMGECLECL